MIIYHIKLPKNQDLEAFVTFMREEYFPAVDKGSTRVGQITDLHLLERENEFEGDEVSHEFLWQIGWSGQPTGKAHVEDAAVARKLTTFQADIKRLGSYRQVADWQVVK
ncbi:hypothetical protein [Hymenobacter jejuensis]|uniref:Uncharacterized protein n=1 Tax=Hymenobacter jejuensis TaxID=2502781 RepID=A0A5B7ZUQ4_9BACT|nr:hypothetical protein [Hymenobacter jejuensis]QDA58924.1 hypothetical protein FHG12_01870 [Hymenobacter jejuensis]